MNQYEAGKAITQQWMTAWPTALTAAGHSSTTPYVFDNDAADEAAVYARVRLEFGKDDEQQTLGPPGARRYRRTGTIAVELKGPGDEGRKRVDQLVSVVRTVVEGKRIGTIPGGEEGVSTFTAVPEPGFSDGQFWILAVATPFAYYETR